VKSKSTTLSPEATAVAAFVGFTAKAPTDKEDDPDGVKPRMVTNWTQYEKLYGGFVEGALLPHSVYGYFLNGGSVAYIVRIPNTKPAKDPGSLALPTGDRDVKVKFVAKVPDAEIRISIEPEPEPKPDAAASAAAAAPATPAAADAPKAEKPAPKYTIKVSGPAVPVPDEKSPPPPDEYKGVAVKELAETLKDSRRVAVDELHVDGLAAYLQTLPTGDFAIERVRGEVVAVEPSAFAGSQSDRTGINGLTIADDVTMVLVPDLYNAAFDTETKKLDTGVWKSVQLALINFCEAQPNRMAVLDAPPNLDPQDVKAWREATNFSSAFAALYYPWIKIANPIGTKAKGNTEMLVPPSGHIAGVWARTDETRGVWKAPANEVVKGALGVAMEITKAEQGTLNPEGINCIRAFGSQGIRVWGARTLEMVDKDWTYINVRRLFNMIQATIMNQTTYAVFEPNDQALWEGLTRTVSSFLRGLWRDGALFGATAEEAFFVKCDAETNPRESIDQGRVIVEVGIAPVKPAEFVIFRVSQYKGEQ
jgi:hypothetical protein